MGITIATLIGELWASSVVIKERKQSKANGGFVLVAIESFQTLGPCLGFTVGQP